MGEPRQQRMPAFGRTKEQPNELPELRQEQPVRRQMRCRLGLHDWVMTRLGPWPDDLVDRCLQCGKVRR